MFDYPRLGAEFFQASVGGGLIVNGETLTAANVFSEALPSREWLGEPTLEIAETELQTRHYIDGSERDFVTLVVLFRANSRATAAQFVVLARQALLPQWFAQLQADGLIDDWGIVAASVAPDVRSLEIGETFSAQISVNVKEKKINFTC